MDDLWHKPTAAALPHRASLQEVVEKFGSFFRTKIDSIRQRLNSLPEASITQPVDSRMAAVLKEFAPVTELEVLNVIRAWNSLKETCQLDPKPTEVIMDYTCMICCL